MTGAADDRGLIERRLHPFPPKRYRLDGYKRWFPETASAMVRYLRRFTPLRKAPQPADRKHPAIGVVVMPWVSTPVPWYAIMIAIGLVRRGRDVVLIHDDTGFPEGRLREQERAIGMVMRQVARLLPVVRLSDCTPAPSRSSDADLIEGLTHQNLVWHLRAAPPTDDDRKLADAIKSSLHRTLPLARGALEHCDLDCVLVPGGIYGTSGLFVEVARERGWRAATFDVDWPFPQICVNGIAAQNADIPAAFWQVWQESDALRQPAIEVARHEYEQRLAGRDRYGFQVVPASNTLGADASVLIPLNIEWDAAALGRHSIFADTVEWLTSTIPFILEHHTGTVVVRQHPSERRPLQRSRHDVAAALQEHFGVDARIRFVSADDPTSTYDLLASARIVLPFVSNIGIEAAAIGKPVLVSGECYYGNLGFVWSARTRDEYFEVLHRGLRGELPMLPDQRERAWICYYLNAVQNRVSTDFTAHPDDFWHWIRRSPESLFADPIVAEILEAIDDDVPVSLLRHRRHHTSISA